MTKTKTQRKPGPISGLWAAVRTKAIAPLITAGLLAISITIISLLLSGCPNPVQHNRIVPETDRQTGTLVLAVEGMGAERTIRPETKAPGDFTGVMLRFADPANPANNFERAWQDNGAGILVYAGTWNLQVTAYIGTVGVDLAASSALYTNIVMAPGGTVTRTVTLLPTRVGTGRGTFAWDIGLPDNATAASMTITPLAPAGDPMTHHFVGGPPVIDSDDYMELDVGQYRVIVTVTYREQTATVRAILHVYQNMTSRFAETFTRANFPLLLLDYILESLAAQGEMPARITCIHLTTLPVLGVDAGNEADVFDAIRTILAGDGAQAPADIYELRILIDAALVTVGIDGIVQATTHRATAQDAVRAILQAANNTSATHEWSSDGQTLTVTVGDTFAVEIAFPSAVLTLLEGTVTINNLWPMVGNNLIVSFTGEAAATDTPTWAWLRGDTVIPGAILNQRIVVEADIGHAIRARASFDGWYGHVYSPPTAQVMELPFLGVLSAGQWHSLGIDAQGRLWAWGNPGNARTGLGVVDAPPVVTQVGGDSDWILASAGSNFSMGIRDDGSLWAWGSNVNARTGLGFVSPPDDPTLVPTRVVGSNDWVYVSAGGSHAMGIQENTAGERTLWAWGQNANGRTGLGTTDGDTLNPTQVGNYTDWLAVSVGNTHSVGIRAGRLYAWGQNANGRTGLDTTDVNTLNPTQVGDYEDWVRVSAGNQHTLGIRANGTLWAWGNSANGRLGIAGASGDITEPTQVQPGTTWAYVSASNLHTLGICTDGRLYAWGSNLEGRTGLGETAGNTLVPTRVGHQADWVSVSAFATPGGMDTQANHTLGIRANGTFWGWGNNDSSRVGDNSYDQRNAPVQIHLVGGGQPPLTGGVLILLQDIVQYSDIFPGTTLTAWTEFLGGTGAINLQWQRGHATFTDIPGATDETFTLRLEDVGYRIRLVATRTGYAGHVVSASTALVQLRQLTGRVYITEDGTDVGNRAIFPGTLLTAYTAHLSGTGAISLQWQRGHATFTDIPGETGTTYTVRPEDAGYRIRLAATRYGYAGHIASDPTAAVLVLMNHILAGLADQGEMPAGITYGHLATLSVLGVDAANQAAVFDALRTILAAAPAPADLDGLRALTDAALLHIATPAIAAGDHANRGSAVTAIVAAAANQTAALAWAADGTSVTVTLGVYSLTIEFAHGLYMVWTVSIYPATGQTTALDIEFCCPPDLTADDITITEGTGAVTPGTLTGTGGTRRLAVTTTRWGDVEIAIGGTGQTARVTGRAITPEMIGGEKGGPMIVAGGSHTMAIRGDGTLWAWGSNETGRTGIGSTSGNTPTPVHVGNATQQEWIWAYVSAGTSHSMGIREDGTLWAWGSNMFGQLGDGSTTTHAVPVPVGSPAQIEDTNWRWAHVAAGSNHAIGIRTDGTLWAWGDQSNGRLGNGLTAGGTVTVPIQIQEGTRWIYATASGVGIDVGVHTVGIREDGTLWAWGGNNFGQLGIGTATVQATPIRVGTTQEHFDLRWVSVSASGNRTMGIQDDGTLWGWGNNPNGSATGDGTTTARNTPTRVGTATQRDWLWASVSAGNQHTVGIREDGTLWAWGNNSSGRLGDGTTTARNTPVQVGNAEWESVRAGNLHTAGIRTDGTFWAWGSNANGRTGLGLTAGNTTSPARIDWTPITGTATLTGTPAVGQTLTADTAGINPNTGTQGTTLVIQWQRENAAGTAFTDIAGATGATYQLQPADLGFPVRAAVSRTGYVFRIFSPATAAIEAD